MNRRVHSGAPTATTMVEVAALIHPATMLIEIEMDAVCEKGGPR
jgi:hypothetical protein